MKLTPKNTGYYRATLRHKNIIEYKSIHRLVAEAFIPNPNNYPIINHINGIKTDNRVENLEWCTYKHNNEEAFRLGLNKFNIKNLRSWSNKFGKEHNCSKKVYQIDKNTDEIINTFYGVKEANRKTGISYHSIYSVVLYKRKTAGGYKWRYANE